MHEFDRLFVSCTKAGCTCLVFRNLLHLHSACRTEQDICASVWNWRSWNNVFYDLAFATPGMTLEEQKVLLWFCTCGTVTSRDGYKYHPCKDNPTLLEEWEDTDVEMDES